jgi:hypothetical protein
MGDNAQTSDPDLLQIVNELKGRITIDVGTPSEGPPELRFIPDKNKDKADILLARIEAALRTLPVERPPRNDIYQSDIGIQFQKGDERVWDNVLTGDSGGGGAPVEPTKQDRAKFRKVVADLIKLMPLSYEKGIMVGNEGKEQGNTGGLA